MSDELAPQVGDAVDLGVAEPRDRDAFQPGLATDERQRVVVDWNDTRRDYANDRCLHELFEREWRRHPRRWPWSTKASRSRMPS